MVEKEIEYSLSLIEPRGIFKIFDVDRFKGIEVFKNADKVAFGIVTIGDKLEKEVSNLFKKGEGAKALILDGIGSAAAEFTANLLNRKINNRAKKLGYRASKRFSPGYVNWLVENQDIIFNSFEGTERKIGVRLTSSKMMVPLKSVSFAVNLGENTIKEVNPEQCSSCSLREKCLNVNQPACSINRD